jgi:hypothetical protein
MPVTDQATPDGPTAGICPPSLFWPVVDARHVFAESGALVRGLRNVEDQDDRPVRVAFVMVLPLRDDKRLLLASRAEEEHIAFHGQAFDRR